MVVNNVPNALARLVLQLPTSFAEGKSRGIVREYSKLEFACKLQPFSLSHLIIDRFENEIKSSEGMSFYVDIITEDSFYENLTLGIVRILENSPCVKNVEVERRSACDRNALSTWEQKHCCVLPDDLRNFYGSVDGLLLTWSLEIAGEVFPVGRLEVGTVVDLKRFMGSKDQQAEAESRLQENPQVPSFSPPCKLFEIGQCATSKIFLSYVLPDLNPEIWLYHEENNKWYHLADSFTKYFRMMLVHLGLPLWQHCVVGLPLPTWIEQVYLLVGPHLLPSTIEPSETVSTTLWTDGPPNTIDVSIFKGREIKQRNARKK